MAIPCSYHGPEHTCERCSPPPYLGGDFQHFMNMLKIAVQTGALDRALRASRTYPHACEHGFTVPHRVGDTLLCIPGLRDVFKGE